MAGGSGHQSPDELTARIEQRLRDAGVGCQIINLVPAPTAVLRRDRIVIVLALALLTVLVLGCRHELSTSCRRGSPSEVSAPST
jgi:hypothetical protein